MDNRKEEEKQRALFGNGHIYTERNRFKYKMQTFFEGSPKYPKCKTFSFQFVICNKKVGSDSILSGLPNIFKQLFFDRKIILLHQHDL